MKAIKPIEVYTNLIAELCGEYKPGILGKQILHVNKRGKITELVLRWGETIRVKGSLEEIKTAFLQLPIAIDWTNAGLPPEAVLFCLRKCFDGVKVEVIEPSRRVAWKVDGTYFGSGSYFATFKTNGTVEKSHTKNTGFAYEDYYTVDLGPNQYLVQYQDASPGACIKRIYVVS